MKRIIPLLLAVLLTGCAGTGQMAYMPQSIPGSGSPYSDRSDAVGTLLDQAWNAMAEEDLNRAGSALSRAMRISPTDPSVYYLMAQLRKEQGRYDQARELADRALSLGPATGLKRQIKSFLTSLG
ncbi:MAG: tetratricopeptide repeat protein [Endozoicomonas sp.]|uniref:tetratricopeptide repeat protein n=1 Tax=Endozoicomonas sp. TaxID=1892382 RepID=UPI003D9B6CE6